MTAPQMQARGTYALTTRCVFRKLLLTPHSIRSTHPSWRKPAEPDRRGRLSRRG